LAAGLDLMLPLLLGKVMEILTRQGPNRKRGQG